MGLFDTIISTLGTSLPAGTQQQSGLLQMAINMLQSPEVGGLPGLIQKLQKGGLGNIAASWVGRGANLPVSGDALTRALGSDKIRDIASSLGMSNTDASNGLASVLPELIDKLTPEGSIPEDNMLKQGLDILTKHFMKG